MNINYYIDNIKKLIFDKEKALIYIKHIDDYMKLKNIVEDSNYHIKFSDYFNNSYKVDFWIEFNGTKIFSYGVSKISADDAFYDAYKILFKKIKC